MIFTDEEREKFIQHILLKCQYRNLPAQKRNRLLLNAKLSQIKHDAEVQKIKNQVDKWIELNEKFIKSEKLRNLWKDTSIKSCIEFVELAIKSLAVVDGINKSEDIFNYVLDMKQIEIDKQDIVSLSEKVFSVDVLNLILNNTSLTDKEKQNIKDRYISSKFPYKDVNTTNKKSMEVDLAERISQELQNINSRAESVNK